MKTVCVYCGANPGADPAFLSAASMLGSLLALQRRGLVYGGGRVGRMGALADAALGAGGRVVGIMPRDLMEREIGHSGLTELQVVDSMHQRKMLMADLADGFVALPGGIGTLEEFFEIWTWSQLGLVRKPLGVLNVAGFFDPLLVFLDQLVAQGFVSAESRAFLCVDDDAERLLERMATQPLPHLRRWLDRSQT